MRSIDILKARMMIRDITDTVTIKHDGHGGVLFTWYYHLAGSTAQRVTMGAIEKPLLNRLSDPLDYMEQVIDNVKARIKGTPRGRILGTPNTCTN